jgi:hypothetical protein
VDFLPLNNIDTSQPPLDYLSSFGGANHVLADFPHFDPILSSQAALYNDNILSTTGWAVSGNNEVEHQQWYNNSMPSYNESLLGSDMQESATSTPVSVNEKLSKSHGPSQLEFPFQGAKSTNTPSLTTEDTANHWTCGCSPTVASLLEKLTPHGVVGVARARDNALLCNLDAIILRNEDTLRRVNGILQCSCSFSISVLLHLAAVMLKILGWYTAIIGIVMRCAPSFQTASDGSRNSFLWVTEFFEPYDAGIDSAERARGYLQLVSSKLEAIRPIVSTLNARLLAPEKRSASARSLLGHRLEDTTRTLLRDGGLCGTLSCKSIAQAFDAELRSRFQESWQVLMDALHSL